MFFRSISKKSGELPASIDGLPVFNTEEPYVLSNDAEIARLAQSSDARFIRVCKFGVFGYPSSHKWFENIRDVIANAEEEYKILDRDFGIKTPEHSWGLIPLDDVIKTKIHNGLRKRREAFFDRMLLPKGYLLGCEVERIDISLEFDRNLGVAKTGFATPEQYQELTGLLVKHVTTNASTRKFTHADLSPEECVIGTTPTITDVATILFDIEPVTIPSQRYPKQAER